MKRIWLTIHLLRNLVSLVVLIFLCATTYWIYAPTIPLFFEGDDFQVLWHIRNPVPFWQKPFVGWPMPIAGRFGYIQAWYEAAVSYFAGNNNFVVLNSFGIAFRMLVILSIFYCAYSLSKNRIVALLCAFTFTCMATGIESTYFVFHHGVLIFMMLVFVGIGVALRSFESEPLSKKRLVVGMGLLVTASYVYTIRMAGLVVLPLWFFIYSFVSPSSSLARFSRMKILLVGVVSTLILFILIYALVPGIATVSKNLPISVAAMTRSEHNMFGVYSEAFLVSVGTMLSPPPVTDYFLSGGFVKRKILFAGALPVFFSVLFVVYNIYRKYRDRAFIHSGALVLQGLTALVSTVWFIFLYALHSGHVQYLMFPRYRFIAASGVCVILSVLAFGLFQFKYTARIAALSLIGLSGALIFYVPNWLFGADIVSPTASRYFAVSSGFMALMLGSNVYLVTALVWHLFDTHYFYYIMKSIAVLSIFLIGYLYSYYLYFHLLSTHERIQEQAHYRNAERSLRSWRILQANVDSHTKPLFVVIQPLGDLTDVKRLFFGRNGIALALDLPYTNELPYFTTSFRELSVLHCKLERQHVAVPEHNVYAFTYDLPTGLHPQIAEGRVVLGTWSDYCRTRVAGTERTGL
jgi:hypothetical protein